MYILEQIQFPTYFKVVGTVSYMYILEQIKVQFPTCTYFKIFRYNSLHALNDVGTVPHMYLL